MKNKESRPHEKKEGSFQKALGYCVFVGICLGIGFYIGAAIGESGGEELAWDAFLVRLCLLLVSLYASIAFHIIVHEAGHLVGGLMSGYGFLSYRVFNLMFVKENGKIRWKWFGIKGTAGQCLMTPPEPVDGEIPVMLFNLGGSVMNLVGGIVFAVLYLLFADQASFAPVLLLPFSLYGFLSAALNSIPMRNSLGSGVPNDGFNAFVLRKNKTENAAFRLQLQIVAALSKGMRPADFPPEWCAMPQSFDSPFAASLACISMSCHMDRNDFAKAREIAETVLLKAKKVTTQASPKRTARKAHLQANTKHPVSAYAG